MISTFPTNRDDHHIDDPLALPIPAYIGDQFSLRYHIALESMKVGKGNAAAAQALLEMVLASGLLADCGHGRLDHRQTREAEKAIANATQEGLRFKVWRLSSDGYNPLCAVITEHDLQLRSAHAGDVIRVLGQVDELSRWASAPVFAPPRLGQPFASRGGRSAK
ncbi:hypothetical protein B0G71_8173 [Paraburkholderia sp. BL27I4N3]|uniref:hypothetical protein n=1 Tax=Paraburkholderia sp. BL27I4N3 TaxID=1938805 RepID=UPI000E36ABD2|nr:hypothetical protein [Paraburkholderia sp. BL27I4N3]REE06498.1 hypothetical protein B0G71_8173 [Paraburkholderia sp. BL27I4N3]